MDVITSSVRGYECEDTPADFLVIKGCGSAYVINSKVQLAIDLALAKLESFGHDITVRDGKIIYDRSTDGAKIDVAALAIFPQLRRSVTITTSLNEFFTRLAHDAGVFNNFGESVDSVAKMIAVAARAGVHADGPMRNFTTTRPSALSDAPFKIDTLRDLINTLQYLRDYAGVFEVFAEKLFEATKKR